MMYLSDLFSSFLMCNNFLMSQWWDSSVHDVDYESFDSMFWIKVRRVKRSQFDAIQTMLECCMNRKVNHAEFSSMRQHLF